MYDSTTRTRLEEAFLNCEPMLTGVRFDGAKVIASIGIDSLAVKLRQLSGPWRVAFDLAAYRGADNDEFAEWTDSRTGLTLPRAEIESLLNSFTKLLGTCVGKRVLDVGVGCGHVMSRLLEGCDTYTGIDVSPASIDRAKQRVPEARRNDVHLSVGDAHEVLSLPTSERAQRVLLNSIIQYLPGRFYTRSLLGELWEQMPVDGRMVVGDVVASELLGDLQQWRENGNGGASSHSSPTELDYSPTFFARLFADYAAARIRMPLRSLPFDNELTLFRFDVIAERRADRPVRSTFCTTDPRQFVARCDDQWVLELPTAEEARDVARRCTSELAFSGLDYEAIWHVDALGAKPMVVGFEQGRWSEYDWSLPKSYGTDEPSSNPIDKIVEELSDRLSHCAYEQFQSRSSEFPEAKVEIRFDYVSAR